VVNRRGLLASVLAFLYPGLGHVYLRRWARAAAWFVLAIATAAVVVPPATYEAFEAGGISAMMEATESFGPEVTLSLLAVGLLNVADAYIVAVREAAAEAAQTATADDAATCPECGGELDEDLDFCPWCTTRFDDRESGEGDEEEAAEKEAETVDDTESA
jgi:hypothetical protein